MDLIDHARAISPQAVTNMRNMFAERKLLDGHEVKLYGPYENGLRSLRDELRLAQSKGMVELLADIGCQHWLAVYRFLTEASAKAVQEPVRTSAHEHNVVIMVDVNYMFSDQSKRQRTFSRRCSVGSSSAGPSSKKSKQGPRDEQGDDSKPEDEGKPEDESEHEGNSKQKRESDQKEESSEQNVKGTQMADTDAEITTTAAICNAHTSTTETPSSDSHSSESDDSDEENLYGAASDMVIALCIDSGPAA